MRLRRTAFAMMVAAGLLAAAVWAEGTAAPSMATYHGTLPQLPVIFQYPAAWQPEVSAGSAERYSQVQVVAPEPDGGFTNYLVVRAVPAQRDGGRYATLDEMAADYRATLMPGLRIDREQAVELLGAPARRTEISGSFIPPTMSPDPQPVAVRGGRVFAEHAGQLYELGWLATAAQADEVAAHFDRLLSTFQFIR